MNVFGFIKDIISPVTQMVDELHTSVEEKKAIKLKMMEVEHLLVTKVLDYEKSLMEVKGNVILAEAKGDSFLQRSWRPITMLTFLGLVVLDSFGWLANPLAQEAWTLLQIGLGGYVVGRSGEKITSAVRDMRRRDHYE